MSDKPPSLYELAKARDPFGAPINDFPKHHTWLSNPPATPAPELPRKVEPGEGK